MDEQAPDIRPNLTSMRAGVRIQFPDVGAVTIPDLDEAGFLAAYPWGWASLSMLDPDKASVASDDQVRPATVVAMKALLAAAVVREFPEPRNGTTVPADDLPGPVFSDALELSARALGSQDLQTLTALLAAMFNWSPDNMRKIVDTSLQRIDR